MTFLCSTYYILIQVLVTCYKAHSCLLQSLVLDLFHTVGNIPNVICADGVGSPGQHWGYVGFAEQVETPTVRRSDLKQILSKTSIPRDSLYAVARLIQNKDVESQEAQHFHPVKYSWSSARYIICSVQTLVFWRFLVKVTGSCIYCLTQTSLGTSAFFQQKLLCIKIRRALSSLNCCRDVIESKLNQFLPYLMVCGQGWCCYCYKTVSRILPTSAGIWAVFTCKQHFCFGRHHLPPFFSQCLCLVADVNLIHCLISPFFCQNMQVTLFLIS